MSGDNAKAIVLLLGALAIIGWAQLVFTRQSIEAKLDAICSALPACQAGEP